jgi:hypothetical protein
MSFPLKIRVFVPLSNSFQLYLVRQRKVAINVQKCEQLFLSITIFNAKRQKDIEYFEMRER